MKSERRSRKSKPSKRRRTGGGGATDGRKPAGLPRGVADRLILAQADKILPGNVLMILTTGTALGKHLIRERPEVIWKIFTCEHFYLTAIVNALSDDDDVAADSDVELFCTPDLPPGEFDTVVFPTDSKSSAELTRDLLQAAANQLKPGGRLIVSSNNPKDHWLHQHLKDTIGRTTVVQDKHGVCYISRQSDQKNKQKCFRNEFAFRDGERLIRCVSRPGVFSHRRVDAGARALIRSLDLVAEYPKFRKKPVRKIVEMGSGCGSVSTAAALRFPDASVLAVDSHARAVQATQETAALNDATNVSAMLTSNGVVPDAGQHDVFLCNPPYYSDFRISELFLQSAAETLRPGGLVHVVTKRLDWHENRMIELFANATPHKFGQYDVIVSRR